MSIKKKLTDWKGKKDRNVSELVSEPQLHLHSPERASGAPQMSPTSELRINLKAETSPVEGLAEGCSI